MARWLSVIVYVYVFRVSARKERRGAADKDSRQPRTVTNSSRAKVGGHHDLHE
jgi:hypothetical protein